MAQIIQGTITVLVVIDSFKNKGTNCQVFESIISLDSHAQDGSDSCWTRFQGRISKFTKRECNSLVMSG